jgi:hypothetical protein
MRRFVILTIAAFLLFSVFSIAGTAFSQTAAPADAKGTIELTPIIVALINLIFPLVGAIATGLINARIKDQRLANQLSNAVQNALGTVQQNAINSLQGKSELKLEVNDPAVQKGVEYVLANATEAIKRFDVPPERIAEKILAKVGLAAIETNRAATQSSLPGVSGPLAPVPAMHADQIGA